MNYNAMKRIWKRMHFWYIWFIVLVLVDEYIKEKYFMNLSDFLKPFTHENLLLLGTLTYIIINIVKYIRGGKLGNRNSG